MLAVMHTAPQSPSTGDDVTSAQPLTRTQLTEQVARVCEARDSAKQRLGSDFWHYVSTDEDVQSAMAIAWTQSFGLGDMTTESTTLGGQSLTWRRSEDLPEHVPHFERGRFDYDRRLAGRPVSTSIAQALRTLELMPKHGTGAPG
jgi:hypothetical protein